MYLIGNDAEYNTWLSTYQGRAITKTRPATVRMSQPPIAGGPQSSNSRHSRFRLSTYLARLKRLLGDCRKLVRPLPLAAAAIILIALAVGMVYLISGPGYRLTPQAQLLLSIPDTKLSRAVTYDSRNQTYIINKQGTEREASSSAPNVLVGQPSTGLYSATLPTDLTHGITITNNSGHISFTLQPEFKTAPIKLESGHFVYPAPIGMQAVYTPQADQLAEDLVLNHPEGNSLTFTYRLILPAGLPSSASSGGAIVINSSGLTAFRFVPPVIRESNGQKGGALARASARLTLTGNTLTLVTSGLAHLTYPITIDPSIVVNSTVGFLTGNNEGDISATSNQFSESGLTGGGMNSAWTTDSANPLPQAQCVATSVAYNGYVYELGGSSDGYNAQSTTVYYAPINANGSVGAWVTDSANPLPQALAYATSVAYNGYVYELGGITGSITGSNYQSTVYYAPINANGSVGAWVTDSANPLPRAQDRATSVVYNGYVYEFGGINGSNDQSTVYYAPINANGSVGAWVTDSANPLPQVLHGATSVAYNGYVYEFGGINGSNDQSTVYYAPINANGSVGAWVTDSANPLPQAQEDATSVAYNGYVYELGGLTTGSQSTVYYAAINNGGPGTLSAWAASNSSLPTNNWQANTVAYNDYLYEIGGCYLSLCPMSTVDYASLNANGTLGSWAPTASLLTAVDFASSVVYNGYIYEIGGCTTGCPTVNGYTAAVEYAPIHTDGTLGSWLPTGSLPIATAEATAVVYNGYIYYIGGNTGSGTAVVDFTAITNTGAITAPGTCAGTLTGSWCVSTSTTNGSLPVATIYSSSVVYNGYIYEIGGDSVAVPTVYYTQINTNGTIGSWSTTTSLLQSTSQSISVAYDGYLYLIGGIASSTYSTVEYAPINSDGTIGSWSTTTNLPVAEYVTSAAVYNGYIYDLGGYPVTTTVNVAALYSIPRVGQYSMLVNLGNGLNVTPTAIVINGTNAGNPGAGGLAGLGGITVQYENGTAACSALSVPTAVDLKPQDLGIAYNFLFTKDGCNNTTNQGEYAWVHFNLDDSQTATFPDINGNHTTVTVFQIYYHPASSTRLSGGMTLQNGVLQSLDAPPTTTQ
jgi:N-acetylneuraminic acid mutarotase